MQYPVVISVDVEDWPQSTWDRDLPITSRVVENTRLVLETLSSLGVRATMFVLGKVAEKFPELVKEIAEERHEIACHGFGHREVFTQSAAEFEQDVRQAKDLLEQLTGQAVLGFRAPDFSIVKDSLWALDVLASLGFEYDSSIFPIRHNRYGIEGWPGSPMTIHLPSGNELLEFPVGTVSIGGRRWPLGGGGYQRLLPGFVTRFLVRRVVKEHPFVFYSHPYEFDTREFRELSLNIPYTVRFHQGAGRRYFQRRLEQLIGEFGGTCCGALMADAWPVVDLAAIVSPPGERERGPMALDNQAAALGEASRE